MDGGFGRIDLFTPDGTGGYTPPPALGVYDALTKNGDGTWSLKIKDDKTTQHFDTSGKLTSIVDRNGNTITFQYSAPPEGRLMSITDASGRVTTFTYGPNGKVTSITDPAGRTATYNYDASGNLIRTNDMAGNTVDYSYDANSFITTITTPKGTTTVTYVYNSPGFLFVLDSLTNPEGVTKIYRFPTSNPYIVQIKDANGNITEYGNTVLESDSPIVTFYIKDALGNYIAFYGFDYVNYTRNSIKDANNHTTSWSYDSRGNLTSITSPAGRTAAYTYDSNDNLISATDPKGNVVNFIYDANGNLLSISNPSTTFIYNTYGELTSMTDALGNKTTFTYDLYGNLTSIINTRGNIDYTFSYDTAGRVTQISDRQGNTTSYQYDGIDRVIQVNFPIGIRQFVYECCGLQNVTDENGKTTRYTYKPTDGLTAQNLRTVTDALNGVTTYEYDNAENLIQVTNTLNNSIFYSYDASYRLIQDGDGSFYIYDPAGNILTRTDTNGNTTSYTYDADDRLIRITYPGNSQVNFTYDNNSNLISMTDSIGTTTFVYSFIAGRDRMISKTNPYGKTVQYGYDAVGNMTSLTYPGNKTVTYVYNNLNKLTKVKDWSGRTTTYAYVLGRYLSSITYPNGVTTTYGYDSRWRLTSLVTKKSSGTIICKYNYTLDGTGNRVGVVNTEPYYSGSTTYTYDAVNRLTSASGSLSYAFAYDSVGNMVSKNSSGNITNYTYDTDNRLLSAAGAEPATFTYDNNGSETSKNVSGAVTTYSYDYENRLIRMTNSTNITQYTYDGLGNWINWTLGGTTLSRYVVDNNSPLSRVLAETDGSGNITAYYIYGHGLLAKISSSNSAYYYHYDGLGSTIAMTDASQNVVNKYRYDLWGNYLQYDLGGGYTPFWFVGESGVMLYGYGLHYMRARNYDSSTGRFVQKDPYWGNKWEPQSLNRYAYVGDNPVNWVDPWGLSPSFGECLINCTLDQAGIHTSIGGALGLLGYPFLGTRGKFRGATEGTSIASKYLSKWLPYNLGRPIWTPIPSHLLAKSAVLGKVLGRGVPWIGWGILAYDAISIGSCVNDCLKEPKPCQQ